jgi:transcriptional regulator with XRE-family HTH domain
LYTFYNARSAHVVVFLQLFAGGGEMSSGEGRSFGQYIKELRIGLGKTLRDFCGENDLDPGNMSKLERGLMLPPQSSEKLSELAECLGIKEGSKRWYEFVDLAAAEAGTIPEDLKEEQVIRRLPVIFRTLRGQKVSEKALDRLVERLKRE